MRAIQVHIAGEDRRLEMEDVPRPEPRPDQILVRATAIGVNRADLGRGPAGRGGASESYTPGLDVGGYVQEVGEGVTGWKEGDPVIALVRASYAEFVPARAVLAYSPPEGMSISDAASIPCVFLTAWYGLTKLASMQPGETVLVHAAGSGVGTAAIQIAKAWGCRVLTSAGSDARVAKGVELGAEAGVNYSTQDVAAELQRLTGGKGVDIGPGLCRRSHLRCHSPGSSTWWSRSHHRRASGAAYGARSPDSSEQGAVGTEHGCVQ